MQMAVLNNFFKSKTYGRKNTAASDRFDVTGASLNTPYVIKNIKADDKAIENFLFTLGCYEGSQITVISILSDNYIINIKDARYSIDKELAKAILI